MDALATVADLEQHLQREFPDTEPARLALELASGAVRAYCGWNIGAGEDTLYPQGDDSAVLNLNTLCLLDVFEARINGLEIDIDELHWSRRGQIYRARGWPRHARIELDVMQGYEVVPDVVRLVVLDLAAKQISNPQGLVSATVGPVSRVWSGANTGNTPGALSVLHERLLDRYSL